MQNTTATKASLIRGCLIDDCSQDQISNAPCVVNSTFRFGDQKAWNEDRVAFTVTMPVGDTLERAGGNYSSGTGGGIWTAVVGGVTRTFDTGNGSEAYFLGSPAGGYRGVSGMGGYWAADVVTWLNTLPRWAAVLSPDFVTTPRVAAALSREGLNGRGFTLASGNALVGTGAPQAVVWNVNTHGDWYQHTSGVLENVIVAFNIVYEVEAQLIFLASFLSSGVAASQDIFLSAMRCLASCLPIQQARSADRKSLPTL